MPNSTGRTTDPLSINHRLGDKVKNTYLQVPFLWDRVVDYHCFKNQKTPRWRKAFLKLVWFWPRLYEAEQWRDGELGGCRNPEDYAEVTSAGKILMDEVIARIPDRQAPLLDLGCNCGRHLNYLQEVGYTNLFGVDISGSALNFMKQRFPDLKDVASVTCSTFQEYLAQCPSNSFQVVFTHGATVELVHPSFPLVRHITRVTRECVVFLIGENQHAYPRFWEREFDNHGFLLTKLLRPVEPGRYDSLMVFNRKTR